MNKLLFATLGLVLIWSLNGCGLFRRGPRSSSSSDSVQTKAPTIDSIVLDSVGVVHIGRMGPLPDSGLETSAPEIATTTKPSVPSPLQAWVHYTLPDTAWTTFNARVKAQFYGGGQQLDFNTNIRMEQGKRIWISATALLNFEVARLLLTPDTVWLINRLTRTVQVVPFSQINQILPLQTDFASLQSLITGGVIRTGEAFNDLHDTAGVFVLQHLSDALTQTLLFSKADTNLVLQYLATSETSMQCRYDDFSRPSGHRFSGKRDLQLSDRGANYRLKMEFTRVDYDGRVDFPFSIPDSYRRK